MVRRVGALMFVFIVAVAPAALTACQIACAAHDSRRSADAEGPHSCHGTVPARGPVMDSGAHVCGHDEELPAASSQAALVVLAAAAPPSPAIVSLAADASHPVYLVISPPGRFPLPVPLRV